MATVYTKTNGVATNGQDLLTKLSTFLTANGFALEFSGDNIISSVNLGKKFIFSKSSRYYYFAASDLNSPVGNNSNYIDKSISAVGVTISKTLNTLNNWFANNPNSDYVVAENKASSDYWFYTKDNNIIIVLRWAANQYSYLYLGDFTTIDTGGEAFFCAGSSEGSVSSSSSVIRLPIYPLFTQEVTFGWANGVYINKSSFSHPMVVPNTFTNYLDVPSLDVNNSGGGVLNKTDNTLNGVSATWDWKIYQTISDGDPRPFARVENVYIVNFANLTPATQYTVGTRKYDVYPFLQKETPQDYQSTSNSKGCGFAIKTDE